MQEQSLIHGSLTSWQTNSIVLLAFNFDDSLVSGAGNGEFRLAVAVCLLFIRSSSGRTIEVRAGWKFAHVWRVGLVLLMGSGAIAADSAV